VELVGVQVANRGTGRRAKVIEKFEIAALGDIDDALEHASGVLRSVRVKNAPTTTLAKNAPTLAF
jgi:hypothetical protein